MDLGAFACFMKLCVIFFHFIMSMKGEREERAVVASILISDSLLKGS